MKFLKINKLSTTVSNFVENKEDGKF